ncbi:glycine zipper 2TM domain-containing protein [Planctomycetota bacterium]
MRTICLYILLPVMFFVGVSGCSTGQGQARVGYDFGKIHKVAVISVEGQLRGKAARNQIADFFMIELMKKGYAPVERSQIEALLEEQKFQASDVTSEQGAARAGRVLNVPAVVIINIPKFKEDMNLTAKMIDVEDAGILWIASGEGTTGKTMSTLLGAAAGAVGGMAVTGDDDDVIGGIAGGVAGGVVGRALAPDTAKKVQEVIGKMCESLPSRVLSN